MKKLYIGLICTGMLFANSNVYAKTMILKKEANIIGGYSDVEKTVGKKGQLLKNSIGLEYYQKFSNDYGDYLTANLQVRLSYDSIEDSHDAWGIEIHNAWLDYKLGLGKSVRFGHFDPAFGLEPLEDTHGTLMQTLAIRNIGYKKDWGVGYRGLVGNYDLQVAAQLGSGMGIRYKDHNYLISARLGSSVQEDFQYGMSIMHGQVLQAKQTRTIPVADLKSDNAVVKKRIGFDAKYSQGPYIWKNEVVYGQDNDADVLGLWSELDYTLPKNQNMSLQLQSQYWINDLSLSDTDELTLGAGLEYKWNADWTVRLGYFHDVDNYNAPKDQLVLLQFYFFGD